MRAASFSMFPHTKTWTQILQPIHRSSISSKSSCACELCKAVHCICKCPIQNRLDSPIPVHPIAFLNHSPGLTSGQKLTMAQCIHKACASESHWIHSSRHLLPPAFHPGFFSSWPTVTSLQAGTEGVAKAQSLGTIGQRE